jgi:hypothetical protein
MSALIDHRQLHRYTEVSAWVMDHLRNESGISIIGVAPVADSESIVYRKMEAMYIGTDCYIVS